MSDWQVKRLAGALGAEIRGVDLKSPGRDDIERIKTLLVEHQVLFFPDQDLGVDEHVALGPHFGDTMWTSLTAAYDALSAPMKALCEGLTALHDAAPHNRPDQMAIHPVVRVHPDSGRKALYVNEHFTRRIVEMSAGESRMLLDYLTRWVASNEFTVRYRWAEGTVAMWDNRSTQHCVLNDFEGERIIHRVTIMGDEPRGACEPRWPPWVRPGRRSATSRHDRQLYMFLKSRARPEAVQDAVSP